MRAQSWTVYFVLRGCSAARNIDHASSRSFILCQATIALNHAGLGRIGILFAQRARACALRAPIGEGRPRALGLAALAYALLGPTRNSVALLESALSEIAGFEDLNEKLACLKDIVEPLGAGASADQIQAFTAIARGFTKDSRGIYELTRACHELVRFQRRDLVPAVAIAAAEMASAGRNRYALLSAMQAATEVRNRAAADFTLAGIRALESREDRAIGLAEASLMLVRTGSKQLAQNVINEALTLAGALQETPASLAALTEALWGSKNVKSAMMLFRRALQYARVISPGDVYATIRQGAEILISIDQGATFAKCIESVLDVEDWWPERADDKV